jgi:hypothetical protein
MITEEKEKSRRRETRLKTIENYKTSGNCNRRWRST